MSKITCPKCKVELSEVLSVDEYIMTYDASDGYLPLESTATVTKCSRCGTVLKQQEEEAKAKDAYPHCRMKLDKSIGVLEALMEYDESEELYLRAKEVSMPKVTRCLYCGADLRGICTSVIDRASKE